MVRVEIIANLSIEEDIIETLKDNGYGESFTYLVPVFGRGRHGRREGSAIWPEENAFFLVYMEDEQVGPFLADLKKIKQEFAQEGIQCYVQRDVQRLL